MATIKKKYFVIIGSLIQILFLSAPSYVYGEPIYSSFDVRFEKGLRYYSKAKFNVSMGIFTKLSSDYPSCSKCFYYGGKSAGKLASRANWFKAAELAKKTLRFFQTAYLLNPNDYEVARDLAQYYHTAPNFLGGDQNKGDRLKKRALNLKNNKVNKK